MKDRLRSSGTWKDDMPGLRARCKILSEDWGFTVFPVHISAGYCTLVAQQKGTRTRDALTGAMKIEWARAIVEWEIAKAEGILRIAA
jgi:hypothetical protein